MTFIPSQTTGLGVAAKIAVVGNKAPLSSVPGKNNVTLSLTANGYPETFQLDPQLQDAAGNEVELGAVYTVASVAAASAPINFVLSAVAASDGTNAVYTGTITGGGTNNFKGDTVVVTGFASAVNNGTFQIIANDTTTLTLNNPNAVAVTAAGLAVDQNSVAVYTGTFTGATTGSLVGQTFTVAGFTGSAKSNGTFICTANTNNTSITLANPNAVIDATGGTATTQELTNSLTYVEYGAKTLSSGTYGKLPVGSIVNVATVSATGLITAVGVGGTEVEISYPTFNNTIGDVVSSGNIMNGLPINKVYASVNVNVLP